MKCISNASVGNDIWMSKLSIGDSLDVKDKSQHNYMGKWMRGKIVDICYLYFENYCQLVFPEVVMKIVLGLYLKNY